MSRRREPNGPLAQWHVEHTSGIVIRHGRFFNAFVLLYRNQGVPHGATFQRFRQGWCFDADSVIISGRINLRRLGAARRLFELPARPQGNQDEAPK